MHVVDPQISHPHIPSRQDVKNTNQSMRKIGPEEILVKEQYIILFIGVFSK